MKVLKILILVASSVFTFAMVGCLENSTEPEIIVDYVASSYYYVGNQTGSDLQITYKIAHIDMDSTLTVPADTTFKIFQSGAIGMPPAPSEVFDKISVYKLPQNQSPPFLTIEPILDEDWGIIDEDLNAIDPESTNIYGEDGSINYKYVITND